MTNMVLILVWAGVAAILMSFLGRHAAVVIGSTGVALGAVIGIMQHLSFGQATKSFKEAATLMDVRRALMASTWGKRSIQLLYVSKGVLIVLSLVLRSRIL
ncbi:MAG: hypothetical protein JWO94_3415 [Verrucomicrobiaceae bacterium]|nr:hypothetical protein [Verrucomicrobiaceae bacterium]